MTRRSVIRSPHRAIRRATPPHQRRGDFGATLRAGKIVAYPTESFYALGVRGNDAKAIRQLFRVKRRERRKPVALIAADLKQVEKFFFMSKNEERLAKKYWPALGSDFSAMSSKPNGAQARRGALTILLKPKKTIAADALFGTTPSLRATPPYKRRGDKRIGVRVPDHAGARRLAAAAAAPITATSANASGHLPTKSARKVKRDFPDILLVPGTCGQARRPSTVVEIVGLNMNIIRRGAVRI